MLRSISSTTKTTSALITPFIRGVYSNSRFVPSDSQPKGKKTLCPSLSKCSVKILFAKILSFSSITKVISSPVSGFVLVKSCSWSSFILSFRCFMSSLSPCISFFCTSILCIPVLSVGIKVLTNLTMLSCLSNL